jgi:ribose 5-phosphate isomerase A
MKMSSDSKDQAAKYAAQKLKDKKFLILGSGSTVNKIIEHLAKEHELLNELRVVAASTSTSEKLRKHGITEISINEMKELSGDNQLICIDGADQISFDEEQVAQLILKGHGAALVREKILWEESDKIFVVVDESKIAKDITKYIPLEVIPLASRSIISKFNTIYPELDMRLRLTDGNYPLITDNSNHIIEVHHTNIDVLEFHHKMKQHTGVVDTGIFAYKFVKKCVFVIGYSDHVEFLD